MSNNFTNWLFGDSRSREQRDTLALYREAEQHQSHSPLYNADATARYIYDLVNEICEAEHSLPNSALGNTLFDAIADLLYADGFRIDLPKERELSSLNLEEQVALRDLLVRNRRFLRDHERLLPPWRRKVIVLFSGLLNYFPLSAFEGWDGHEDDQANAIEFPEAQALDLCDRLHEVIERTIGTLFDDDVCEMGLFEKVRTRLEENLLSVSGIDRYDQHAARKIVWPTKNKEADPARLVSSYLRGTPFPQVFETTVPFAIPFPARFEHTHIVAGSGHGKTQLLQFLIHHDLLKALDDKRSVIVMDSQGDMIRTLSHLKLFDSYETRNLADRFVLVDPTDVEHPIGLNMFDFDRARVDTLSTKDREMILNATVETYEYFFGALLGAELTQRQGVIFRYIARLMMEIPDATIHTLLELMMNGEKYRPYMNKLTGTARTFFATQFFDRQFSENKKQITARLWGVLSNATLERMFSHPKNKLDLFRLTQEGKIILVNTAKDFLGHEGSSIFGRFVVSLIAQAAIQRAILPAYERTPTFAYIDEAEDYFDENIDRLVNQARKYKIGLLFSHQNLDQLSQGLRASVLASTSIKFAGGVSSKDANALDTEFRTTADFLLAQKKLSSVTEFACYVKNFSPKAISVRIPLGYVENQPTLDDDEYESLIEHNREQYSVTPQIPEIEASESTPTKIEKPARAAVSKPTAPSVQVEPAPVEETEIPTVTVDTPVQPEAKVLRATAPVTRYTPKEQGGGGKQHKYLAHLVKQLAEERGFKASIEEEILDGAGRVDVALARGTRKIAVEISVTTGRDWELQNVEKCLSAGYEEVFVVSTNERHLKSLARFIPENLDEAVRDRVRYLSPEDFISYLDQDAVGAPAPTEKVVRGYKVRVVSDAVSEGEAEAKRNAIAEVIARSMLRGKG